jgi:2-polyprenyl-3-methyl-5-hydroxy-6-metoxy-1,4-benzoquinol methylase
MADTKEPQYQVCLDIKNRDGLTRLGLMANQTWHDDPKRLTFVLSRYKFVAKMFSGLKNVVEIGCADAFATRIVQQEVSNLTALDFDPIFVEDVKSRMDARWPFECRVHDILDAPPTGSFDGAYAMDVLEHIPREKEDAFFSNIAACLTEHGTAIVGTPSIQSQAYASAPSREGHVNCKDGKELKQLALQHFHNVFVFSMNDEVVHTGYHPMAQYLLALCVGKRGK